MADESQPAAPEPPPGLPEQKPASPESAAPVDKVGAREAEAEASESGVREVEAREGSAASEVAPHVEVPAVLRKEVSQKVEERVHPEVRKEVSPEGPKKAPPLATVLAAYEHPWAVRFTHWVNAASIFVLAASGLQIFRAFPSFGPKIPQDNFMNVPKTFTLGGWLGGALQWHFTFMWIFMGSGVLYLIYQFLSGHYRTVLFTPRDIPGVWPMVRHYFLFGSKPPVTEQYNPLQKLAYTSTVLFGLLATVTGLVLYKPVQFSWLAAAMGGFHFARGWHFFAMCGFLAFIPGHLIMVVLHGWANFVSMLVGWKRDPEYLRE